MDLHRLIYTSVRRPKCDEAEIQKILNSCNKNNRSKDITGVLLHSNKRFIQYLEGDKEVIQGLYEAIQQDDRHGAVNLRDLSPINKRLFPSWAMGYKDVNENSTNFNTRLGKTEQKEFKELIEGDREADERGVNILKMFFEMV